MKLGELLKNVDYASKIDQDAIITGITADSRKVKEGMVFVAITGTKADGHEYIEKAKAAGAAAVIAERGEGVILVDDSRLAYSLMADAWYKSPAAKLKLVGVTGTNGKTSTACLIKHIIDSTGGKCGLVGTISIDTGSRVYDADVTTPDAMELHGAFAEMVEAGCTHCVMEVSSHALDQKRVGGMTFECGIFTNLTQDHLDYHGDMASYLAAKAKLFEISKSAALNYDDEATNKILLMSKAEKTVTYSIKADSADMTAKNIALKVDGIEYQAVEKGNIARVKAALPGEFNVYNTLAAITGATLIGIPLKEAAASLLTAKGIKGRIEIVPTDTPYTVYIDYSHTPDSLLNIGRALKGISKGRIITVFGCGGDRDRSKRPLMAKAAESFSDYFVLTSDNPRTEDPERIIADAYAGVEGTKVPHKVVTNRKEAIAHAMAEAKEGDTILIAGKGHETYQIIGTEKFDFDEREIVKDILGGKV